MPVLLRPTIARQCAKDEFEFLPMAGILAGGRTGVKHVDRDSNSAASCVHDANKLECRAGRLPDRPDDIE
jgi:hypothetical protein